MCTVSFVNSNGNFIITSNRDEQLQRERALLPSEYRLANKKVTFPKDPLGGGTWFAVDEVGNVIVLLNGAVDNHKSLPPYRKSRGLIVLDLIAAQDILVTWKTLNLDNIEPFTLVMLVNKALYLCRWNGEVKTTEVLDTSLNYIWSSATLYSEALRAEREVWFAEFLGEHKIPLPKEVLHFHRYTKPENKEFGLQISRGGVLQTLSITQVVIENDTHELSYIDLSTAKKGSDTFVEV